MAQQIPPTSNSHSNAQLHTTPDRVLDNQHYETTPKSSTSIDPRPIAHYQNSEPSPAPGLSNRSTITPQPAHTSLPPQQTPPIHVQPQQSLKRTASNISDMAATQLPPRKRPRRDEIPIWARSARKLPLKFANAPPSVPPPSPPAHTSDVVVKKELDGSLMVNGQGQPPATTPPTELRWEPSILNEQAYDDLTRMVADWIF